MRQMRISEGFHGQMQWVIPRTILRRWAAHPMLQALVPTDIGWYPQARYHYREREQGVAQHILIFCVDGAGWYEIEGQRRDLARGEVLLIPRNVPHIYGASAEAPWSIHWVHFMGKEADFFAYHLPENAYTLLVDAQTCAAMESLFQECYESFIGGFVLHRLIYCAQILRHLLGRLFFNNTFFSPVQRTNHFHSLEPTLTYMHQKIHQNLSLQEMADHAGLSVSHFSYLFKQQTGYSPMDYFIHLKMQHACTLLSLSVKAVHEIALEVGYSDPYYFSRIFKKVMGMSPRQYRQSPTG